jgi:hypothetical protein
MFQGLDESGTIAEIQERVQDCEWSTDPELEEVQGQLNIEYLQLNAKARDG